ncbi:Glucokinase [Roseibacterium elongatum DSM 19469]|uniref:Glucokinase n=1 Tax=Roseicyclus elongatus DSM 19469 TaxID=1294273 RepID=W8SS46_9RHOB|nr:glucokinase [Roseibacterium elongatum]AHM05355.1 Glucokinase [Roseibacterium elongatum DSM 19469]
MHDDSGLSLVADIGGTNTRVALARGPVIAPDSIRRFRNADHAGLATVLHAYLGAADVTPADIDGVCVAAAGPVRDGVAQLTNLDWRIDRDVLAQALTADKVAVLNDLQAQGHAIGHIASENLTAILPQPSHTEQAAKLVVGIGTGFNACPVFDTGAGRFVPPSEAGHVSLPASEAALLPLVLQLTDGHGHASVEEVLSGRGVSRLHRALHGREATPGDILAAMAQNEPEAVATGRLFVRVMGVVIGDLALSHLPFGGIYLIGGVTRHFLPWLGEMGFGDAFRDKGRFSGFMEQFGVTVVTDDYAALTGCASHLARL